MPVKPVPDGYHTVTPYLIVKGAAALIDFLKRAFDATQKHRTAMPNGVVMHAEVRIGDSPVMMGEVPKGWTPQTSSLYLYVPDVDALYSRAIAAGAESVAAPTNQFYGDRMAGVKDPCGNTWWMATHIEDVPPEEIARRAASAALPREDPK